MEVSKADTILEGEKNKSDANEAFKNGNYELAIELYSRAIDCNPFVAVYFGNRSFAYLKEELYGAALSDATKAIEMQKDYMKGYYRRATANMALGKFKLALKDYETVYKRLPNDLDAKKKFDECSKIVRRRAFEKAIHVEQPTKSSVAETIDLEAMVIEADYSGPHLAEGKVTPDFMLNLLAHLKSQGKLHKKYAFQILVDIRSMFMDLPSLVDISVPDSTKFTVCGDVHGQFYDLLHIFELNGLPSETNPYLFNGDFVDRGAFSVETIFTLFAFKLLYPNHFFMSRGNHESEVMNQMYGFEGEVKAKYNAPMAQLFTEIYCLLPLCHLINKKVFCTHGGLFKQENVKIEDIRQIDRIRQPPEEGLMCDLLWSDPCPMPGRTPSKRGVGIQFGPDVTQQFLDDNQLDYVIRSHEVKPEGYELNHKGKCITVFSAPNYCDTMGNKGAFITMTSPSLVPSFTTYEAVAHPNIRPMAYASNLFGF